MQVLSPTFTYFSTQSPWTLRHLSYRDTSLIIPSSYQTAAWLFIQPMTACCRSSSSVNRLPARCSFIFEEIKVRWCQVRTVGRMVKCVSVECITQQGLVEQPGGRLAEIESFFDDRIISKALWPPRSPELSPPDFFMWGALKRKAYAKKQRTMQELENNIRRAIAAISEDVLQATFVNMKRRVQLCLDSGGEHFQHLLQYRHASHEARYVVIYACSKSNEQSLIYSHFLGSSTERITLYILERGYCCRYSGQARCWTVRVSNTSRDKKSFHFSKTSRQALGPTQLPTQCVNGFYPGDKATTHFHLAPRSKIRRAKPPLPLIPPWCGQSHIYPNVFIKYQCVPVKQP